MAYGLQVFSATGAEILNISDRLTRVHSTYTMTLSQGQSQSISVPGMSNNGTWAVVSTDAFYLQITIGTEGFTVLSKALGTQPGTFNLIVYRF